MLEAAPPSDACSSLMRGKPRPKLGSRCGPGGRKREEGDGWKDTVRYQRRGRKGREEHQSSPPNRFVSLCRMGTAIVLPLCWGKNTQEHGGLVPGEKGHKDGFASPCPCPLFYSPGRAEPACVHAHCPEKPGRLCDS